MDEPGAVLGQNIWRAWPLPFPLFPSPFLPFLFSPLPLSSLFTSLLPFSPIRSRPFKYRGSTDIKSPVKVDASGQRQSLQSTFYGIYALFERVLLSVMLPLLLLLFYTDWLNIFRKNVEDITLKGVL